MRLGRLVIVIKRDQPPEPDQDTTDPKPRKKRREVRGL